MSILIGQRINSKRFTFSPSTREFCAEISEFNRGGVDPLGRLFADSGDRGFVMVSNKTGKEVMFVLTNVLRDADRNTRLWELAAAANELAFNPDLRDVRVVLFNDV